MKEHLCNPLSLLLYLFFQFQELVLLFFCFFFQHRKPMVHILLADTGSTLLSARMLWFRQGTLSYWSEIMILLPGMNKLVIWLWSFSLGHDKESFFVFFSELYVNFSEELCLQSLVLLVYIGSNTKEDRSCQLDEKMTKWDWSKRWRQIMKWWKEKR